MNILCESEDSTFLLAKHNTTGVAIANMLHTNAGGEVRMKQNSFNNCSFKMHFIKCFLNYVNPSTPTFYVISKL